jgi:hypothetical protein
MSLRTESSHAYQTANHLKNSWNRKFPRHKRAPCYWFWHVILHFNCIVAFNQGLSCLIKNLTICGERTLLANVLYHEAGVIVLEEVVFVTVSIEPSPYTKCLMPARTTRTMGLFWHWSRQAAFASKSNLLFEMASGVTCLYCIPT